MLRKYFLLTVLIGFLSVSSQLHAQDAIFSQYYASPLHVNPSLTGLIDGSYRIQGAYRDQWKSLTSTPFVHLGFGGDIRFKVNPKSKTTDLFGVGLNFNSNRTGIIDYTNNELSIFGSYHKLLGSKSKQFLSAGFKFGIVQRGISYANLNFADEFDGINEFSQTSAELLPQNVLGYADLSLGLNFSGEVSEFLKYSFGTAIHHLNSPRTAFVDPEVPRSVFGQNENINLAPRINIQALIEYKLNSFQYLSPRILWTRQADIQELRLGTNLKFRLLEQSLDSWHIGLGVNVVDDLNGFAAESATVLIGIEYKAMHIGLSYDLSLRDFADSNSLRQRGFELSVSYFGDYENEVFFCPEF